MLVIVAVLSSASAWKYYLINHTPMTWAHAQRVCRATNDSELLTFGTPLEFDWLAKYLKPFSGSSFWIGVYGDPMVEGGYAEAGDVFKKFNINPKLHFANWKPGKFSQHYATPYDFIKTFLKLGPPYVFRVRQEPDLRNSSSDRRRRWQMDERPREGLPPVHLLLQPRCRAGNQLRDDGYSATDRKYRRH